MARRVSPSQLRSQLRQVQSKAQRALNDLKTAARKVDRAVDNYNREVRAHNARARANRARLERELARLRSAPRTTTVISYRRSVTTLRQSFSQLERAAAGDSLVTDEMLELCAGETANSVAALNALLTTTDAEDAGQDAALLRQTIITNELADFGSDLDSRWRGALFALHPQNPDAARHFCTSAREMLSTMLVTAAPDEMVVAADPDCDRTPNGDVSRRARIRHCLRRIGWLDYAMEDFVEENIKNVLALFGEFNSGAHGAAGRFGPDQLRALKSRVEDAIKFVHRVASQPQ